MRLAVWALDAAHSPDEQGMGHGRAEDPEDREKRHVLARRERGMPPRRTGSRTRQANRSW